VYDKVLYARAREFAEAAGIKAQTKTRIAGGNDSSAVHTACGGVRTCAISVPCRYLHTPSCVIKIDDLKNVVDLTKKMCINLKELPIL